VTHGGATKLENLHFVLFQTIAGVYLCFGSRD
jgi:hypothetical protein